MAKRTKKMANKKGQEKKVPFSLTARVWTDEELKEAFSHM